MLTLSAWFLREEGADYRGGGVLTTYCPNLSASTAVL